MGPKVSVVRHQDGIAILTFHNAPVNALSTTVLRELSEHLKELNADDDIRAVVLHGSSAPGFFACGTDLTEFPQSSLASSPFTEEVCWCFTEAEAARLPVVAAIDGVCLAGGLELILCCAARVATSSSTFSLPECNLGMIPGLGGTQRLPRVIGFEQAARMILLRSNIDAKHALSLGLLDEIAPPGTCVVEAATEYARKNFISEAAVGEYGLVKKPVVLTNDSKLPAADKCELIAEELRCTLIKRESKDGTHPHFEDALSVMLYGVRHGGIAGLEEEKHEFERLLLTPNAQALVRDFLESQKSEDA